MECSKRRRIKLGRSQTRSDFISRIVIICLFIILFVIIMIPFYAVALSSFKPGESLVRYGLNLSLDFEIMSFIISSICLLENMIILCGFGTV